MKPESRILFCDCARAGVLSPAVKQAALQALSGLDRPLDAVEDLCELAAKEAPLLSDLAAASQLVIAACHPRAVKWLFAAGGAALREDRVDFLDLRGTDQEQIVRSICELAAKPVPAIEEDAISPASPAQDEPTGLSPRQDTNRPPAEWNPWFPVIDYDRCENCKQCLGFCLFGVYGAEGDGKVRVQNPTSCKTGCPACARVCPSAAIVFPKYPYAPINGGDVKDGGAQAEPIQVDKTALLSGDILKALQDRGKNGKRFAVDPGQVKAVQERLAHLAASKQLPDVPLIQLAVKRSLTESS